MIYVTPHGDPFTLPGHYRRRTLWQWLTRRPRQLQLYRAITALEPLPGSD